MSAGAFREHTRFSTNTYFPNKYHSSSQVLYDSKRENFRFILITQNLDGNLNLFFLISSMEKCNVFSKIDFSSILQTILFLLFGSM